ncbi:Mycobacterium rhizamassiliense ORFan [Mycobacterium rhizamassiliense]|uniref:Mycobacterium rhizamassiliense ORFan n=1 Tax=Mycobacterium rhizamassiliense TaxID=1841860 RepID=A0A2U3P1K4_9MYCO|nr:Mycobacterium rhizamassiliense ORFan [Mycobacterium rhizamassiliense]
MQTREVSPLTGRDEEFTPTQLVLFATVSVHIGIRAQICGRDWPWWGRGGELEMCDGWRWS